MDEQDMVEDATKDLKAWTAVVDPGTAKDLLTRLSRANGTADGDLLIVRADMVFGIGHLRSALYHAKRAVAGSTNSSDSLAMETLLYASGERQLSSAIRKMSAGEGVREVVIASLGGGLRPEKGWTELEEISGDPPIERLRRFGIEDPELSTCRNPSELVLERVAAVDILKK